MNTIVAVVAVAAAAAAQFLPGRSGRLAVVGWLAMMPLSRPLAHRNGPVVYFVDCRHYKAIAPTDFQKKTGWSDIIEPVR